MRSGFEFSDDNKRYHTYNYFLRKKFGRKVFKVSLDAGCTCPNRDGSKGSGGCIYCSDSRSGEFAGDFHDPIEVQFESVKAKLHQKWSDALYIPYFQAGTNTYGDEDRLMEMFIKAAGFENAVGLAIATRADCISDRMADMLAKLSEGRYLTVELGLQTVHDSTARLINRCHSYEDFLKGYKKLADRGINVCVHLINGLPGESREMMLENVRETAKLKPHSIKLHMLHVLKGTALAELYLKGELETFSRDGYVKLICDQLELIPAQVVIQRLTGDGAKDELLAPMWSLKKFCVLNEIDKELQRRDSYQGIKCLIFK